MYTRILVGAIGAVLLLSPLSYAQDEKRSPAGNTQARGESSDMQEAIAFERAKERAAERQARIEARRTHSEPSADRTVDDNAGGRKVKDSKAPGAKRDPRDQDPRDQ